MPATAPEIVSLAPVPTVALVAVESVRSVAMVWLPAVAVTDALPEPEARVRAPPEPASMV